MLRANNLQVGYEKALFPQGLDLQCPPAAVTMIFGANGIGKTTLLQTLAGLRAPLHGSITYNDRALTTFSTRERAREIAYVHSLDADNTLIGLRVREVVQLGRAAHLPWWSWQSSAIDLAAIDEAIDRCALGAFSERMYNELSSGERQRVWLAAALAGGAPVILLDEPTSRLDVRYAREMLALLREIARAGATVITTMHDVALGAVFADTAIVLHAQGVLAVGPPEQVLTTNILSAAYETAIIAEYRDAALWLRYG